MSKLYDNLNEQMNMELEAAYIYATIAAYLDDQGMAGMTHYIDLQVEEEIEHAQRIRDFLREVGHGAKYRPLDPGAGEFTSILHAFETALDHEKKVTASIHKLVDEAKEEGDQRVLNHLIWFVDEQIEEEDKFTTIVERLKRVEGNWAGLYQYDAAMGQRK